MGVWTSRVSCSKSDGSSDLGKLLSNSRDSDWYLYDVFICNNYS